MSEKKNTGNLKSIRGGKNGNIGGGAGGNGGGPTDTIDGNSAQSSATRESPSKVIDFEAARAQRSNETRRSRERFFLSHMIEVYCEIEGGQKPFAIEVVEVSEDGCSFRLPIDQAKNLPRDASTVGIAPIQTRIYFSRDSYLRVGFEIVNSARDITARGSAIRYGCRLDGNYASAEAYRQFVRFMEQFAKHATSDDKKIHAY